jgi:hypothetical protein
MSCNQPVTSTNADPTATPEERAKIRRFEQFHEMNPHVYAHLVQLATEWIDATGKTVCGITLIYNKARWDLAVKTAGDEFELNNDYAPFYARMIMWNEPDLAGLFHRRASVADKWTPLAA